MNTQRCLSRFFTPCLLLLGLLLLSPCDLQARSSPGGPNLALVATPSSSYTSGDTSLAALNDGRAPERSLDEPSHAHGNWPRRGTQWVQYSWAQPIKTNRIEVYWWDDHQGVRLPVTCRLLSWDGSAFVPIGEAKGLGVAPDTFNVTTFPEIETTMLRLEMDGRDDFSTGVLEWRVLDSGNSPTFPPVVFAGVDRSVVSDGETHLEGTVNSLRPGTAETRYQWTLESGPGEAVFTDPTSLQTNARFTKPGTYIVALQASEGDLSGASKVRVNVVSPPPVTALLDVTPRPYSVSSPFWKPRLKSLIVRWIPYCYERMSDPELAEGGIANFDEAAKKLAGLPAAAHKGYVFSNAWVVNMVEAMSLALMLDPDGDPEIISAQEAIRAGLDDWIPKILAAQEPDGYLQTAYTLSGRERWTQRHDHEGYITGYFLEAAIAHHRLTQGSDRRLYDAAKQMADCWDAHIGPPPRKAWYDGHQALEIALGRFAALVDEVEGPGTGDRYRALEKYLLDQRGGGSEYDQSHQPVTRQYEAVGHAVRAVYSYAGMADVAIQTGDRDYLSAVESIWDNLINRKYYVTGGVGSGETSEGFGPDYSLRNNAYCESCSGCGQVFFQHRMNRLHHKASYADLYETTLYNAVLGDLDLEGANFYYQNPLDAGGPRYPWHVCPCCVGNIPRTLLSLPTWMYTQSDDAIQVNLYIGSTVTLDDVAGTRVELVQETDYPWNGRVALEVNPEAPARFTIRLRSPQRDVSSLYTATPNADGIQSLRINGAPFEAPVDNGYVVLNCDWREGDRIELELPMVPQRVHADERIEANRGRVALRYGPLIYNVESVDQNVNAALAPDSPLSTAWRPDLLGGVVVIKGTFADGTPLLAIPNYARQNRPADGPDQRVRSLVWIREAK